MYRAISLSASLVALIAGSTPAWCIDTPDNVSTTRGGNDTRTQTDPVRVRVHARMYLNAHNAAAALSTMEKAIQAGLSPSQVLELRAEAMLLLKQFRPILAEIDPRAAVDDLQRSQVLGFRGAAHLGLGELDEAAQSLHDALALMPTNARALMAQAVLAKMQNDPAGALEHVEHALQVDPRSSRAWQLKGELLYLQRRFAAADQAFTKAIRLVSSPTMIHFRRAMARLELGDLEGGAADIAAMDKVAPLFSGIRLAKARLFLARQDPQATLAEAEIYLSAVPDDPQGIFLAGIAAMQLGRDNLAEQYLLRLNELVPERSVYVPLLARLLLKQGKHDAAQAILAPIVANTSATPELAALQADILRGQGKHDEADEVLKRFRKSPTDAIAEDLRKARKLVAAGQHMAAIDELDRLVSAEPTRSDARLLRIECLIAVERADEALSQARILIHQDPDDIDRQLALGSALRATGDLTSAKSVFATLLATSPDLAPAHKQLAQIALQQNATAVARQHLDRLLSAGPAYDTWALLNLVDLNLAAGETDTAIRRLSAALDKAPDNLGQRIALARIRLATDNAAEALRILQAAPADQAETPILLRTKGLAELAANQPESAVASFVELVGQQPTSASAHALLARASAAAGQTSTAEEQLARAIRIDREHTLTAALLEPVIRQLGGGDHGAALLKRLQSLEPEHPAIALMRGQAALSGARYAEAEELFGQKAAEAAADSRFTAGLIRAQLSQQEASAAIATGNAWQAAHPDAFATDIAMLTADAHLRLDQPDEAASLYQQVIEHDPDNATALNNLAFLRKAAAPAEALESAERAVALNPESASFLDTLATVLTENGQTERAVAHLAKAHEAMPTDPGIAYRYARVLAMTGDKTTARELLLQLSGRVFPERAAADRLLTELTKNVR